MKSRRFDFILLVILLVSLCTSCAAAGNMITQKTWIGLLDLAVAGAIAVFIFRGSNK
ncbi:MAG: hypothetical protein V4557_10875 [Bacteroidota bacterium]